jgi:hypothetical protein
MLILGALANWQQKWKKLQSTSSKIATVLNPSSEHSLYFVFEQEKLQDINWVPGSCSLPVEVSSG